MEQIITSAIDTDLYKFSQGQVALHQFDDAITEWAYKCRNKDIKFTKEMADEINHQIDLYCTVSFTEEELDYLRSITWLKESYINFLRLWRPLRSQITCSLNKDGTLNLRALGPWYQVMYYEIPLLAIVSEVYFKLSSTEEDYKNIMSVAITRFNEKINKLERGDYKIGAFSEFGARRRISKAFQDYAIGRLADEQKNKKFNGSTFVGTSNVWLAMKYGVKPCGTQAHESTQVIGQGYPEFNPAYSNKRVMEAWVKEYGTQNGIALTDCITTDCFLLDFNSVYANLFSGVRHDSGDPYTWGEKLIEHYKKLGIDPMTKTLLFSDSLDLQRADGIFNYFKTKAKVAFGIGTYWVNDTTKPALNEVMKVVKVNGHNVAKLSDTEGKGMCESEDYVKWLKETISWRLWNAAHK